MKRIAQALFNTKEKCKKAVMPVMAAATAVCMNVTNSYAFQGYSGKSSNEIINGVVDVIAAIASFIGIILLASSIFVLVMAFKNEEIEGKHRAGLGIGVAIALLGFGGIMAFFI